MINRKYGWKRQLPDARDRRFSIAAPIALPPAIDLRTAIMPPVYDQGQIGSCTANAIAAALQYDRAKQELPPLTPSGIPSRLFIYYNERLAEGSQDWDSGAQLRDGIKAVASQGAPDESLWPYDEGAVFTTPPAAAYDAALNDVALLYRAVNQDLTSLKTALASGYPVVFGFSVYDSFESDDVAKWGEVPMPNLELESLQGGHAVVCVGYNDAKQVFIVRNSWGSLWADGGYCVMPYNYLTNQNLASDFWVISNVGQKQAQQS